MRSSPLALTLGEPAGIGPEITGAAWRARHARPESAFFLIGDADYQAARTPGMPVAAITQPSEAEAVFGRALPVLHRPLARHPAPGTIAPETARDVVAAIDEAVALALSGQVSAIVTNPIQKDTLYQAGFRHQGHTDYLAHRAEIAGHRAEPVMMLVADRSRAVPVTVHIALKDVPQALTTASIIAQARVVAASLARDFRIARPRLAISGLNPHAGENGAMGSEERTIIAPAIAELRSQGFDVAGPLPADTAFHPDARARYDAILCMYHDQALIPVKTLDFHGGVNVTLGLPFRRTSPDHGTALALAGAGSANPRSLIAALDLAQSLCRP